MKNRTGGVLKRSPSPVSSEMFIHPEWVLMLVKSSVLCLDLLILKNLLKEILKVALFTHSSSSGMLPHIFIYNVECFLKTQLRKINHVTVPILS